METGRGGELNKQDVGGGDCGFDGDLILECECLLFSLSQKKKKKKTFWIVVLDTEQTDVLCVRLTDFSLFLFCSDRLSCVFFCELNFFIIIRNYVAL